MRDPLVTEDWSPYPAENDRPDPAISSREIAEEVGDAAGWLAGGGLPPEDFIRTLTTLEARKLARFGLTLSSASADGSLVHFSLRFAASGELCASMDVDIETGEVEIQAACS